MILSAHQPTYLPWCGTFAKISAADVFCIFDCVPFSRHDYANRVQIKTHDGVQWLTVPVEHTGERTLIKDVMIAPRQPWQRKHLRAIEVAYRKAPHFDAYYPQLKLILETPWESLADLNECLLYWALSQLKTKTRIVRARDYDFEGEKSALVLDMCRKLGAKRYIFGANGRDYADVAAFDAAGIEVEFQDYRTPVYPQLHGAFVGGLSIVDALMNCGPEAIDVVRAGQAVVA